MPQPKAKNDWRPWWLGAGVACLGALFSLLLAQRQSTSAEQTDRARLQFAGDAVVQALGRRIDAYTEIAFGLRGLFVVDPATSRKAFAQAVQSLDVETRYPGIKNIAFTRYVTRQQRQGFEQQVRADRSLDPRGYPGFVIRPPGQREEYFVADYLWPDNGSQGVHGLDISAQPANLESMKFAMATGKPTASGPFDLIQEKTQRTGFVIRVPVFGAATGSPSSLAEQRSFLGSVAVTLRAFDLFSSLEQEGVLQGLRLSLRDNGSFLPHAPGNQEQTLFSSLEPGTQAHAGYSAQMNVYGRLWKVDLQPTASYLSPSERQAPLLIGLAGGTISALLGLMVGFLRRDKSRALLQVVATGEALQDSEQRYRNLVGQLSIGVLVQSATSEISLCNDSALTLLGLTRDQLLGKTSMDPAWNVIGEDGAVLPGPQHPVPRAIATGKSVHGVIMGVQRPASNDRIWLRVDAHPRLQADGAVLDVVCTFSDITERIHSRRKLQTLSRITEQAPISILITDLHGSIEYANPYFLATTGYSEAELLGRNPRLLQSGNTPRSSYAQMWEKLTSNEVWRGELHNRRKNGELFTEKALIAPVADARGRTTHYVALKEDVTEYKRVEASMQAYTQQLKALSQRVLEVQETERRRLAIELHDELGQLLTAIKINLQSSERFQEQAPGQQRAENLRIVEEALRQVRRLALALRPSMLDDLGLLPALRWMAEQRSEQGGFLVSCYAVRLPDRLAPDIEVACFRIVQEALTNVTRYAAARSVEIKLLQEAQNLLLTVQDDGRGFDVADATSGALLGGSLGLLGMKERAALIGGHLDILSSPGQGCTVRLQCPLHLRAEPA